MFSLVSQSSKMGQGDLSPRGLRPQCGSISHPYGSSQSWILTGNLRDFFINLAKSLTVAISISAGYRSGFPHILILSVAK